MQIEDEIVKDIDWNALRHRIEFRNEGIFAHGMTPISGQKF